MVQTIETMNKSIIFAEVINVFDKYKDVINHYSIKWNRISELIVEFSPVQVFDNWHKIMDLRRQIHVLALSLEDNDIIQKCTIQIAGKYGQQIEFYKSVF